jgi:hypothetical protein
MTRVASHRFATGYPDVRTVEVFIYALTEPDTGEVRYVGKSANPKARLAHHISASRALPIRAWVESLRARGLKPGLRLLHTVEPGEDADMYERHFIAFYDIDRGERLLNYVGGRRDRFLPMKRSA